jgi:hypothetical protein
MCDHDTCHFLVKNGPGVLCNPTGLDRKNKERECKGGGRKKITPEKKQYKRGKRVEMEDLMERMLGGVTRLLERQSSDSAKRAKRLEMDDFNNAANNQNSKSADPENTRGLDLPPEIGRTYDDERFKRMSEWSSDMYGQTPLEPLILYRPGILGQGKLCVVFSERAATRWIEAGFEAFFFQKWWSGFFGAGTVHAVYLNSLFGAIKDAANQCKQMVHDGHSITTLRDSLVQQAEVWRQNANAGNVTLSSRRITASLLYFVDAAVSPSHDKPAFLNALGRVLENVNTKRQHFLSIGSGAMRVAQAAAGTDDDKKTFLARHFPDGPSSEFKASGVGISECNEADSKMTVDEIFLTCVKKTRGQAAVERILYALSRQRAPPASHNSSASDDDAELDAEFASVLDPLFKTGDFPTDDDLLAIFLKMADEMDAKPLCFREELSILKNFNEFESLVDVRLRLVAALQKHPRIVKLAAGGNSHAVNFVENAVIKSADIFFRSPFYNIRCGDALRTATVLARTRFFGPNLHLGYERISNLVARIVSGFWNAHFLQIFNGASIVAGIRECKSSKNRNGGNHAIDAVLALAIALHESYEKSVVDGLTVESLNRKIFKALQVNARETNTSRMDEQGGLGIRHRLIDYSFHAFVEDIGRGRRIDGVGGEQSNECKPRAVFFASDPQDIRPRIEGAVERYLQTAALEQNHTVATLTNLHFYR